LIDLARRTILKMSAQIHVVAILTPAPGKEARASSARNGTGIKAILIE
jgi:hypothetical protein